MPHGGHTATDPAYVQVLRQHIWSAADNIARLGPVLSGSSEPKSGLPAINDNSIVLSVQLRNDLQLVVRDFEAMILDAKERLASETAVESANELSEEIGRTTDNNMRKSLSDVLAGVYLKEAIAGLVKSHEILTWILKTFDLVIACQHERARA